MMEVIRKFLLSMVALGCVAVAIAAGILLPPLRDNGENSEAESAEKTKPLPVKTINVESTPGYEKKRLYTGVIKPRRQAELSFQVAGVVKGIPVDQGASVTEGTLLVALEDDSSKLGKLTSPIDGVVASIDISEGTAVRPGVPVMKIVQRNEMEAWVGVPVNEASRLEGDDTCTVLVNGEAHEAKFLSIQLDINPLTRTRMAVFRFDEDTSMKLFPGETVQLELRREEKSSGSWVPVAALSREIRGLWSVFVVEEEEEGVGRISRRYVEVVYFDGKQARVEGDLEASDQVVADGGFRVVPGQRVVVENDSPL